jgi:hypothetical protein
MLSSPGLWAIAAYYVENPSVEGQEWLMKHPPGGAIDLACPEQDRAAAESVLEALGFRLRKVSEELRFEDARSYGVNLWLFRRARDGGRIYPKGGLVGEDWYYPPECITNGRLGSVHVRTEGPDGLDRTRAAQACDVKCRDADTL